MAEIQHNAPATPTPTDSQPRTLAVHSWRMGDTLEAFTKLMSFGLALSGAEEAFTGGEVIVEMASALEDAPEYATLRDSFRQDDAEYDRYSSDRPAESNESSDFALRHLWVTAFRAGQLAERATGTPQPSATAAEAPYTHANTIPCQDAALTALPFVRDTAAGPDQQRLYWTCPESQGYEKDQAVGRIVAGAYFEHLRGGGVDLLARILAAMPRDVPDGFVTGFTTLLEAWSCEFARGMGEGVLLGIARDLNAVYARNAGQMSAR